MRNEFPCSEDASKNLTGSVSFRFVIIIHIIENNSHFIN